MVERSLRMREARGSIPRVSNFAFNEFWAFWPFPKRRRRPITVALHEISVKTCLGILEKAAGNGDEEDEMSTPGFLESLWRDIDMNRLHKEPYRDLNLIIVSHGLTCRVFLMKWFKWTVEQFEHLNNLGNCEFRVMELGEGGEYSLAIHHTDEEMQEWGMSPEMIADQKWRIHAHRGDWNDNCPWYFDAFFDHLKTDVDKESDDKADDSSTTCE
ncbi:hypothetical protein GH714_003518 [Hevea brasiliensis]|uniref:Phosphoglycerate mutase-like protein n=1 Tax=Hevea brasiliensis TaxID=3981 RepID=A0A6A6KGC2_HEVBR|nr:hypothetical protein GH714_003518 [Hevea brasiliensis]